METLTQPGPRKGDAQTDPGRVVKGLPNTGSVKAFQAKRRENPGEESARAWRSSRT